MMSRTLIKIQNLILSFKDAGQLQVLTSGGACQVQPLLVSQLSSRSPRAASAPRCSRPLRRPRWRRDRPARPHPQAGAIHPPAFSCSL